MPIGYFCLLSCFIYSRLSPVLSPTCPCFIFCSLCFAAYNVGETPNAFNGPDNPQNCLFSWGFGPSLIHGFYRPTKDSRPNYISISAAVRHGSRTQPTGDTDTHIHTNRPRYSVCSNTPHLAITAMRPRTIHRPKRMTDSKSLFWLSWPTLTRHWKRWRANAI